MIYKYIRFSTDSQDERQQGKTMIIGYVKKMAADSVIKGRRYIGVALRTKNENLFNLSGLK